jgi:hypothetical protein
MMKKFLLTVLSIALTLNVFAQTAEKTAQNSANPDMSAAQKATLDLVRAYDLSGEQAQATLKIQQAKVQNLADIQPLLSTDIHTYAQKRFATVEIASNEFSTLLDPRQITIFKEEEAKRAEKIARYTRGFQKQGVLEKEIPVQLLYVIEFDMK